MSNAQEVVKLYEIESWDCQGTCQTTIFLRDTQRLGHGAVASQSYQEHVRNLGPRAGASERASEAFEVSRSKKQSGLHGRPPQAPLTSAQRKHAAVRKHACAGAAAVDLRAEARLC